MKKLTALLLMVTALCLFSASAFAAVKSDTPDFESLDADRNGFISTEEAASCEELITDFAKIDANQDGKLDQAEYAAFNAETSQNS
jgi:starvation-inducible outer membrane lipoprotein